MLTCLHMSVWYRLKRDAFFLHEPGGQQSSRSKTVTRSGLSEQDVCGCSRETSWEAAAGGLSQEEGVEGVRRGRGSGDLLGN